MLDGAVSHRRTGNLLFVHGGIDPAVPIEAWFEKPRIETDSENHWGWVRFPFFFHQGSFQEDVTVVHGHSPENMIGRLKDIPPERYHMLDGHRIGLDAGSFLTGRVAGAEFIDGRYRVYIAADSDRQQG
jgi:serine/threonine protein phosphatase 1